MNDNKQVYTEDEVDALKDEARDEGYEDGFADGEEAGRTQAEGTLRDEAESAVDDIVGDLRKRWGGESYIPDAILSELDDMQDALLERVKNLG